MIWQFYPRKRVKIVFFFIVISFISLSFIVLVLYFPFFYFLVLYGPFFHFFVLHCPFFSQKLVLKIPSIVTRGFWNDEILRFLYEPCQTWPQVSGDLILKFEVHYKVKDEAATFVSEEAQRKVTEDIKELKQDVFKDNSFLVSDPPEIFLESANLSLKLSEEGAITCSARGNPDPIVRWVSLYRYWTHINGSYLFLSQARASKFCYSFF